MKLWSIGDGICLQILEFQKVYSKSHNVLLLKNNEHNVVYALKLTITLGNVLSNFINNIWHFTVDTWNQVLAEVQ